MKKTTETLEHEGKYHIPVMLLIMKNIQPSDFWTEVKLCKTGIFRSNQIRLKQMAILSNPNPVGVHISDSAMDFGGSRALDCVCARDKYLSIVYLENKKPYVIPIHINIETKHILKQNTKLSVLQERFRSYPL
jgi:hypothetical protein